MRGSNIAMMGAIAALAASGGHDSQALSLAPEVTVASMRDTDTRGKKRHRMQVPNKTTKGKRHHQCKGRRRK